MRRSFILSSTGLLVVLGLVDAQSPKAAALIKELSDKNPAVRRSAAQEIGDLADVRITDAKAALPALKEALGKDADPAVRSAVLTALGKIEPDQFPALLTDVLKKDKEGQVQIAAIAALGQLAQQGKRATDAIPVLMEVYKASPQAPATPPKTPPPPNTPATDPPAVRRAILQAYAQLQPDVKERIPFLTDSLKAEKDNGVRTVLINALG
jgi:HEAT repeat protein